MSAISRILASARNYIIGPAARENFGYEKMSRIVGQWKTQQTEMPKIQQSEKAKYSFPSEESELFTKRSVPGDGDVIHLDISKSRLSDEQVAKFLKGDTVLKWKKQL
ncbi:MAG: hypothetical protein H6620_11930 [Halobacteriovoraceae bacterium]|nr:hypothetical protein [Halobacteriovoraceae bacterium]